MAGRMGDMDEDREETWLLSKTNPDATLRSVVIVAFLGAVGGLLFGAMSLNGPPWWLCGLVGAAIGFTVWRRRRKAQPPAA